MIHGGGSPDNGISRSMELFGKGYTPDLLTVISSMAAGMPERRTRAAGCSRIARGSANLVLNVQ